MVTYQFEVDDEKWTEWKNTVPRSKSLEQRLNELIEADTEGRVREEPVEEDDIAAEDSSPAPVAETDEPEVEQTAGIDEILARWEPMGENAQQRLDAGRAVLEYVREQGKATKDDIFEDVYPENEIESQSEDTWWRTTARGVGEKNGALALAEAAGAVRWVRTPPNSDESHHFLWVGDEIGEE